LEGSKTSRLGGAAISPTSWQTELSIFCAVRWGIKFTPARNAANLVMKAGLILLGVLARKNRTLRESEIR
jgi:hypothetical protein